LTPREHQIDGIAERINEDVNFGGQSAAGSADRLLVVFFVRRRCADERARWWRRSSCIRCLASSLKIRSKKYSAFRPPIEALVDDLPIAKALREIAPRDTSSKSERYRRVMFSV